MLLYLLPDVLTFAGLFCFALFCVRLTNAAYHMVRHGNVYSISSSFFYPLVIDRRFDIKKIVTGKSIIGTLLDCVAIANAIYIGFLLGCVFLALMPYSAIVLTVIVFGVIGHLVNVKRRREYHDKLTMATKLSGKEPTPFKTFNIVDED